MLRIVSHLKLLKLTPAISHNHQTVRWKRKPIWMPTAKSKLFRIPLKPKIPTEETEEIQRLFNNYRTAMKSVRQFLTTKYSVQLQAKSDTEALHREFKEDLARCQAINDQWNADVAKVREERLAKQLSEEIVLAETKKRELLEQKAVELEEAERIVKEQKEIVGTFITPENLDEAIEKALANSVDYNFAIDLDGNFIRGRETKPVEKISVKQ